MAGSCSSDPDRIPDSVYYGFHSGRDSLFQISGIHKSFSVGIRLPEFYASAPEKQFPDLYRVTDRPDCHLGDTRADCPDRGRLSVRFLDCSDPFSDRCRPGFHYRILYSQDLRAKTRSFTGR